MLEIIQIKPHHIVSIISKYSSRSPYLILLVAVLAVSAVRAQTISVAEAREMPLGSIVEVTGIATNGQELGNIRYIQDATAGMAVYAGNGSVPGFEMEVMRGDEILVRGELSEFQGLLEISPILSYEVLSTDNVLPIPEPIVLRDLEEDLEGQLVSVHGVLFEDGGGVFAGGETYTIADATDSRRVYIRNGHPLVGTSIPVGSQQLTGIASQFIGYQLLLRDNADIQMASDLYISSDLEVIDQTSDGFTISWSSSLAATTALAYGESEILTDTIFLNNSEVLDHEVRVTGLDAAGFYYVQGIIERDGERSFSPKSYISTSSNSSGAIEVFFTQAVNESFSTGLIPDGQSGGEIEDGIITRIDQAKESIDFCAYNNSRDEIVDALARATLRGVRVRYIHNIGTSNTAIPNNPVFPILGQNSSGLMHNKFIVIDAGLPLDAMVITGSMNFTDMNVFVDYNNMLFIQDQALAKAYTVEFNEMWGSETIVPNEPASRSGSAKFDNTPHVFNIGGKRVELYFSPSDRTTRHIREQLDQADRTLEFALLSFTRDDLGIAVIEAFQKGVEVRGMIDNSGDQGSEYNRLLSAGIPMDDHPPSTQLHHKYAIIDAAFENEVPVLITGSHNWSNSAEEDNDENTLFIFDADIANLYVQEFEARWGGGSTGIDFQEDFQSVRVSPVPAQEDVYIEWTSGKRGNVLLCIHDIFGREKIKREVLYGAGRHVERINISGLLAGWYVLTFTDPLTGNVIDSQKLIRQ